MRSIFKEPSMFWPKKLSPWMPFKCDNFGTDVQMTSALGGGLGGDSSKADNR